MLKRIAAAAIVLIMILCMGSLTYASVQGYYLRDGSCTITPGTGYVYVKGDTNAYEPVESITVELKLYKEMEPGYWLKVWGDSATANNADEVKYRKTKVTVDSGYNYKLCSIHSIKNGSYYESNDAETSVCYVN